MVSRSRTLGRPSPFWACLTLLSFVGFVACLKWGESVWVLAVLLPSCLGVCPIAACALVDGVLGEEGDH